MLTPSSPIAMRMGYHRDPSHFSKITPFEGEMRRRTFFLLEIFDILFAYQNGLPSIVHEEECDVQPPSNLFDTDFDEDTKQLPPSRPATDPTPILFFCYKCRMTRVFRRILRHALSLKSPSYEETMKLDTELRDVHNDVPPSLRMRPLGSSFMDSVVTTSQRLMLDLMYLKCLCVLHRTYLSHRRSNPAYEYSRKTCVEAALRILMHQADLHTASQTGGLFHRDQWICSTVAMRDSLLAAMIISLDLYESRSETAPIKEGLKKNAERYHTLKTCHEIWLSRSSASNEAMRASKVLGVMLSKLTRPSFAFSATNTLQENFDSRRNITERDAASSTGTLSSNASSATTASMTSSHPTSGSDDLPPDFSLEDPLFTIFGDSPGEQDWVGDLTRVCKFGR